MTIQTDRLILRELEMDDVQAIFRIESQPEMVRFQYFAERTRQSAEAYVRSAIEAHSQSPRVYYELAIELDASVIGRIGCVTDQGSARLWYVVEIAFQGKGIAKEASSAFISAIWDETEVQQFEIECDPRNIASWKLAESLGFSFVKETPHAIEVKGELCGSREYLLSRPNHD